MIKKISKACTQESLVSYLVKSLLLMTGIYLIAIKFAILDFWIVVVGVLILSAPVFISGVYSITISKISLVNIFSNQGIIFSLYSARLLRMFIWLIWSIFSSVFILVQFHTYKKFDWIIFFSTAPVFYLVYSASKYLIAKELKTYLVTNTALRWARVICPIIMLAVNIYATIHYEPANHYSNIIEAVKDKKLEVSDIQGSNFVRELSETLAFYEGIKLYALSKLEDYNSNWYLLALFVGWLIVSFNACSMLSCILIPKKEYLRIFSGPLSIDEPAPISNRRIAMITAIITFITLFVYLPIFSYIETKFQVEGVNIIRKSTESFITLSVDKINNLYFKPGTIDQINNAKYSTLQKLNKVDIHVVQMEHIFDESFIKLYSNVDDYLDWYYSLEAEYGRLLKLLNGDLDEYLKNNLERLIYKKDIFQDLENAHAKNLSIHSDIQNEYKQTVKKIMDENRIDPSYYTTDVKQNISLDIVLTPPVSQELISLNKKLMTISGGGAIGGVITAAIGKKIVAKITGKSIFKAASKALTKFIASKAVSTTGGIAAGATSAAIIGSTVPVVGTILGGMIGGIIGGVAVDRVILKLDEEMNREQFRNEIIASIDLTKEELRSNLFPNQQ